MDQYYIIPSRWSDIFRRVVLCVNFEAIAPELHGVYHSKRLSVYHFTDISVIDSTVVSRIAYEFNGKVFDTADNVFEFLERVEGGVIRG